VIEVVGPRAPRDLGGPRAPRDLGLGAPLLPPRHPNLEVGGDRSGGSRPRPGQLRRHTPHRSPLDPCGARFFPLTPLTTDGDTSSRCWHEDPIRSVAIAATRESSSASTSSGACNETATGSAAADRTTPSHHPRGGVGKPETFDFLGLTHFCGKTKNGRFWVRRKTISKRMRAKLAEVKDQIRQRMHHPIPEQGAWLGSVVRGHLAYYAVPGNTDAVAAFRTQVTRLWFKALRRRSQKNRLNWERMNRISTRWLPPARVQHPFPNVRFDARTQGRSPLR